MSTHVETASEIRPFHVEFSEDELAELRRRILATRWPSKELVEDPSQGVQLAMLQELARCKSSRAIGAPTTTSGASRRSSTPYRSSRPRSTASTSTSSTFARRTRTRCR